MDLHEEKRKVWRALSQTVAEEGFVLLRNDNGVLPLGEECVAVFGQVQCFAQPAGHPDLTFTEGLIAGGVRVEETLYEKYRAFMDARGKKRNYTSFVAGMDNEMPITREEIAASRTAGAQKAIVVLKRTSWENSDMQVVEGDYLLSAAEKQMLADVSAAFAQVILVLETCCVMDLSFLGEIRVDGILYVNNLGDGGSAAVARVLKGEVNPSGKLPMTMARRYEEYPTCGHFGQHGGGLVQDYTEDIFVGYRYFDTFGGDVVFPFGFGLSYTTFAVSDVHFTDGDTLQVTATVTNTGDRAGKEVLQLYCAAPALRDGAKLGKPQKELRGFEKTRLLQPGEQQTLTISVPVSELASYDDTGVLGEKSVWVLEKGDYTLLLGTNSRHVQKAGVHPEPQTRIVRRGTPLTTTLEKRLTADGSYEPLASQTDDGEHCIAVSSIERTVITAGENLPFSSMKKDEQVRRNLLPGTGGGYRLTAVGGDGTLLENMITLAVDGVAMPLHSVAGVAEITLPVRRCQMTVMALCDHPAFEALAFEKTDTTVPVAAEEKTVIKGQNYYEGSFYVEVENFADDGNGVPGSCVTHFFLSGMSVIYRINVAEAGNYTVKFRYRYDGTETVMNSVLTLAVSNIVQPLRGMTLENTCEDGKKRFVYSNEAVIELPQGVAYLKLLAEAVPFVDICEIVLERTDRAVDAAEEQGNAKIKESKDNALQYLQPDDGVREGITLADVEKDGTRMEAFLFQLSNRELATLVSGTSLNRTPYGDVGCNHPLYVRGVPAAQTADGPRGLRQRGMATTLYPPTLILTASFNKELYSIYGTAMGEECRFCGVDLWLAPAINIFRDPCGGRNFAYSSEDPYLSGVYATGVIKAAQACGIGTVLKHYCANNTEFERLKSNSRVSERALREIYIRAFEAVVRDADPVAIMSSYNHVNDIKACENRELITDIPRNEWHWDGVFMTDWWNDSDHVAELKAGHDLKMATGDIDGVAAALDKGDLPREEVYPCAARVMRMLLRLKTVQDFLKK